MSITRVPSLLEQATRSNTGGTNPAVLTQLGVYSKAEVSSNLASYVRDISGALTTDIENLDLSLTNKIDNDCILSDAISGAGTTITGHILVTINGVTYKLATTA